MPPLHALIRSMVETAESNTAKPLGTSLSIRRATRDDLDRIAALHHASIRELCCAHYSETQISQWIEALRPEGYALLLTTREFLVADEAGELVGFAVLDLTESLINATYVSPGAARQGVGRRLLEELEKLAGLAGLTSLRLGSTLNAVPFYQRLGYTQEGVSTNRLPNGVELPCVTMSKRLGESAAQQRRPG